MSISLIVTAGIGNANFSGSIPDIVTFGYGSAEVVDIFGDYVVSLIATDAGAISSFDFESASFSGIDPSDTDLLSEIELIGNQPFSGIH